MKFLKVYQAKKTGYFFPAGSFFFMLQVNVYGSAQIPRKLSCPKEFLVTCLKHFIIFRFHDYSFTYKIFGLSRNVLS